jgi:hypothetical protein
MKVFLPGGDLSSIEKGIDWIIDGLTSWKGKAASGIVRPASLSVEASSYQEALDRVNDLYLRNLWGDGLPIVPPTEERVAWMLRGTDRSRDELLGKVLPRGGLASVETAAIAAAMAGCRPEYLPILIAAIEGVLDPLMNHQHMQATTGMTYPAVVVNGPVARQVRLNAGYGCLGPSSAYPAGAAIGRALRLLLMNVGGAVPGIGSMSIYGGPGKLTSIVFAEDEAGLPADWEPLSVERGAARDANTVTVIPFCSAVQIFDGAALTEKDALDTLFNFAGCMGAPAAPYFSATFNPKGVAGIVLLARGTAQGFVDLGWSKDRIRRYLWEHSKMPKSPWLTKTLGHFARRGLYLKDHIEYPMPISVAPENIMVVVAGGEQSGHSCWLSAHGACFEPAMRPVTLPRDWGQLLEEADKALGAQPAS